MSITQNRQLQTPCYLVLPTSHHTFSAYLSCCSLEIASVDSSDCTIRSTINVDDGEFHLDSATYIRQEFQSLAVVPRQRLVGPPSMMPTPQPLLPGIVGRTR